MTSHQVYTCVNMAHSIAAVIVHTADVERGLTWYQQAFPTAGRVLAPGTDFECLHLGELQLELVLADDKVASGPAGAVVYWRVADLDETLTHLTSLGATLYRGPLRLPGGLGMCQVRGGNLLGLRGVYTGAEARETA